MDPTVGSSGSNEFTLIVAVIGVFGTLIAAAVGGWISRRGARAAVRETHDLEVQREANRRRTETETAAAALYHEVFDRAVMSLNAAGGWNRRRHHR